MVKPIKGYECPSCDTFHKDQWNAQTCCDAKEVYQCSECNDDFETIEEAKECCTEGEE